MHILISVIVPVIAIVCLLLYVKNYSPDKNEKEMRAYQKYLASLMLGGILTNFPTFFSRICLGFLFAMLSKAIGTNLSQGLYYFLGEGIFSVGYILIMLYAITWKGRYFTHSYQKKNGILFAVSLSLGYIVIDNPIHALSSGHPNYLFIIFAVPVVIICGVILGYFYSLAKEHETSRKLVRLYYFLALIVPTIIHSLYYSLALIIK